MTKLLSAEITVYDMYTLSIQRSIFMGNTIKNIFKRLLISLLGTFLFVSSPQAVETTYASYPSSNNGFDYLQVPTQITKLGNTYYIADCYHDQIIYSENLNTSLKQWKVMTNNLHQPHALASDGTVYVVVDTENHRVISYTKSSDRFHEIQTFEHIGKRPHYITYEPSDGLFYVWSSLTGEMYLFRRTPDTATLTLAEKRVIPLLDGLYVRSFTIIGDSILFPCVELGAILQVNRNTFEIEQYYPVPDTIAGMVQIVPIGDYFYITISSDRNYDRSSASIIRTKDLSQLQYGGYENLQQFFGNGTPYYISHFDGSYFMTHHDAAPKIYRFQVENNNLKNISGLY